MNEQKKNPVGRPPLGDQHTKRLSLRLRPDLHAWLTQYAAERGIPLTTAANNAIATFRALRETPDLPGQKSPNKKP